MAITEKGTAQDAGLWFMHHRTMATQTPLYRASKVQGRYY